MCSEFMHTLYLKINKIIKIIILKNKLQKLTLFSNFVWYINQKISTIGITKNIYTTNNSMIYG